MKDNSNYIVKLYTHYDFMVEGAYNVFLSELAKHPSENEIKLKEIVNNFCESLLPEVDPTKLFIDLTPADSVVFRFFTTEKFREFRFEIFADYDSQDPEDTESILHIYENKIKQKSYFGSIEQLFTIVKDLSPSVLHTYGIKVENYSAPHQANIFYHQAKALSKTFGSNERPQKLAPQLVPHQYTPEHLGVA